MKIYNNQIKRIRKLKRIISLKIRKCHKIYQKYTGSIIYIMEAGIISSITIIKYRIEDLEKDLLIIVILIRKQIVI
jgi:hypothetical protein